MAIPEPTVTVLMYHMEEPHSLTFDAPSTQYIASLIEQFCNKTRCCFENILIIANGRRVVKDPAVSVWNVLKALPGGEVLGEGCRLALGICDNPGVRMLLKRAEFYEQECKRLHAQVEQAKKAEPGDAEEQLRHYRELLQDARRTQSQLEARTRESAAAHATLQAKLEEAEAELKHCDSKHQRIQRRLRDRLATANQQAAQIKMMKRGVACEVMVKDFRPRHVQQAEINRLKERTKNLEEELEERDAEMEERNKQLHELRRDLVQAQQRARRWESQCIRGKNAQVSRHRMLEQHIDQCGRRIRQLELENERIKSWGQDPHDAKGRLPPPSNPSRMPVTVGANLPPTVAAKPLPGSKLRRDAVPFTMPFSGPAKPPQAKQPLAPRGSSRSPPLTLDQAMTSANGMNTKARSFVPSPKKRAEPTSLVTPSPWEEALPGIVRCGSLPDESIWGPDADPMAITWRNQSMSTSDSEISAQLRERATTPHSILSFEDDEASHGDMGQAHLPTSLLREMAAEDQGVEEVPASDGLGGAQS